MTTPRYLRPGTIRTARIVSLPRRLAKRRPPDDDVEPQAEPGDQVEGDPPPADDPDGPEGE